jgi:anaphase-promoting complex subunit 1
MPTVSDDTLSFTSPFRRFLNKNEECESSLGSDLLKAIRAVLSGTCAEKSYRTHHTEARLTTGDTVLEELTWDSERVIISFGGVIHRQWSFAHEGQPVQWACKGWLEMAGTLATPRNTSHYTSEIHAGPSQPQSDPTQRPIFGPFKRAEQQRTRQVEPESRARATFVFLRSIGKIYLENGLEYTFNLPFIVRRAWPIFPYGVMIQRQLDDVELQEAEILGDDTLLPTVFTLFSPLSEATVVGIASRIFSGADSSLAIPKVDEDDLKLLRAKEAVVSVIPRSRFEDVDLVVTVDVEQRRLSLWRYAYIKTKDTPSSAAPSQPRKSRQSTAPPHGRRSSLGGGEREPMPTINDHPLEAMTTANPRTRTMPPLSALPGMAPSLTASTTMANLAGAPPSVEALDSVLQSHGRRDSLGRNDLSVGLDRMALGGRAEMDAPPPPPREHGKMKVAHWVTRIHSFDISEAE